MKSAPAPVRAAGAIVWRASEPLEICLVHRPKYDDWSFPKGKLDGGERWEDAALREVQEELGLRCRLGDELPPTSYTDPKGRAKVVRYWLMEPLDGAFAASREVDEMRWLPVDEADALLSYAHDRELLGTIPSRTISDGRRAG